MIKTTLKIEGMACGMCESHINDIIRNNFNIKKVSSSFKNGITEIISENPLDKDAVKAAIDKTGYAVLEINSEQYQKKGLFGK